MLALKALTSLEKYNVICRYQLRISECELILHRVTYLPIRTDAIF